MPRRLPTAGTALIAALTVACSVGMARESRAQATEPGLLVGHVVDSTGRAVADAEILATRSDAPADAQIGRSRADGRFVLEGLASGPAHRLIVRRVGYRPDTTAGVIVRPGDTTRVVVVLRPAAVALPTVTVRERRAARFSRPFIDATEIAAADIPRAYRRNAWDIVHYLRPVMLGHWNWKCPSTEHVFVNGIRETSRNIVKPADVLARIPADDIAEMRYVNCSDTSMPGVAGSNTVYVVLKPGRAYQP